MAALKIWEMLHTPGFRLADDPGNIALAEQLMVNPNDPYLRELFDMVVVEQFTKGMTSGDPFYGEYPPLGSLELPQDNTILIGFMPTADPYGIPIFEREGHVVISGPTRQGKTNVLRIMTTQAALKGCCVVVTTHKPGEFSGLMTLPSLRGIARVLRWTELVLAFLEPPPGVPRLIWAVEVVDMLARCFGLFASRRLLLGSLTSLYRKNAIEELDLAHWARYLRGFDRGKGLREEGYKEGCWWVVQTALTATGGENGIFAYSRSTFLRKLFSEPGLTVIEGFGLPSEIFAFLMVYMIRWLYLWRVFGGPRFPRVKIVLDDATAEVDDRWRMSSSSGMSSLDELFTLVLAIGIEFYYACHKFGRISDMIRSNTLSYLFCCAREDFKPYRDHAGLTEEQYEKLRILQPGELVGFVPVFWPRPVYLRVPYANPSVPSEEARKAGAREFLGGVRAMKPGDAARRREQEREAGTSGEAQQGSGSGEGQRQPFRQKVRGLLPFLGGKKQQEELSREEKRILVTAATEWGMGMTAIYRRVGVAPRKGQGVVRRLEAKGYIRLHVFSGRGRGGRVRVIEVTDEGWGRLEALGIQRERPLTHGGWEHDFAARLVEQAGRRGGYQVEYEVAMFDRRFDVVWSAEGGEKTFYEVELSRIDHAVENLMKAMEIPGVTMFGNRIFLVVRDRKDAERARKLLAKKGRRLEEDGVISIRCISDYDINI